MAASSVGSEPSSGSDTFARGVVDSLEAWLDTRDHCDYSHFADIFTSARKLRAVLLHYRSHSSTKPPFGAQPSDTTPDAPSIDVRPEQEQADSIWHSLLWKWLLMPRGLTILRNDTVVFGMNKAFDFSAAGLHRSEAGGRVLRAIAAATPGGEAPLQVRWVQRDQRVPSARHGVIPPCTCSIAGAHCQEAERGDGPRVLRCPGGRRWPLALCAEEPVRARGRARRARRAPRRGDVCLRRGRGGAARAGGRRGVVWPDGWPRAGCGGAAARLLRLSRSRARESRWVRAAARP